MNFKWTSTHRFKKSKTGKTILSLPDTAHLFKVLGDRHDELTRVSREKNWDVIKDIESYHKEDE